MRKKRKRRLYYFVVIVSAHDLPCWSLQPREVDRVRTALSFWLQHLLLESGRDPSRPHIKWSMSPWVQRKWPEEREGGREARGCNRFQPPLWHTGATSSRDSYTPSWSSLAPSQGSHGLTCRLLPPGRHDSHRVVGPLVWCQDGLFLWKRWRTGPHQPYSHNNRARPVHFRPNLCAPSSDHLLPGSSPTLPEYWHPHPHLQTVDPK